MSSVTHPDPPASPVVTPLAAASRWAHPRLIGYAGFAAVLLLVVQQTIQRPRPVGATPLIVADAFALVLGIAIGLIGIAYYRSFKARSLLFISVGFIGSAAIDGVHILQMMAYTRHIGPELPYPAGSAVARLFLAILMLAGWRAATGRILPVPNFAFRDVTVTLLAAVLLLGLVMLQAKLPYVSSLTAELSILRLADVTTGVLFTVLLGIFLTRGDWRHFAFQHWCILALICLVISELMIFPAGRPAPGSVLLTGELLRLAAYALVFTALLISTSSLFSQASSIQLEQRVRELMDRLETERRNAAGGAVAGDPIHRVNHAGTFELDLVTGQLRGNDASRALLNLGLDEHIDSMQKLAEAVHPDDLQGLTEGLERCKRSGELFKREFRLQALGEPRWLQAVAGVETAEGVPVRLLGYLDDVTDRVVAVQALRSSMEAQLRSNKDLQMFAHIVSHDLQEPLRMVSSFMALLQRRHADLLNDEAREFIQFAVEGATRMRSLLDGLLEYSRVQSKGHTFEETHLKQPLQDALDNLSVLIRESGATIDVGPLPTVACDRNQMMQLFQNLISNAIKFCRPGPPKIRIRSRHSAGRWIVDVEDNGIGIDPAQFGRIFQIFQRLNGRDEYPGTGVGLAICNRIMDRHGGRIEVDSTPGEGSRFSLYF